MTIKIGSNTFVCSPDIAVFVKSYKTGKILDLSRDVESFSMQRASNSLSSFSCKLSNEKNKYDGTLRTNDLITVFLRRVEYLQVFTGYLTKVPLETLVPGVVDVMAKCTLKKLEHTYWDPYTPKGQALMPGARYLLADGTAVGSTQYEDGGAARSMYELLTQVAGWDKSRIYIQNIPVNFMKKLSQFKDAAIADTRSNTLNTLNSLLMGQGYSGGIGDLRAVNEISAPAVFTPTLAQIHPLYDNYKSTIDAASSGRYAITGTTRAGSSGNTCVLSYHFVSNSTTELSNTQKQALKKRFKDNFRVVVSSTLDPLTATVYEIGDVADTPGGDTTDFVEITIRVPQDQVSDEINAKDSSKRFVRGELVNVKLVNKTTGLGLLTSNTTAPRVSTTPTSTTNTTSINLPDNTAAAFVRKSLDQRGDIYSWGAGRTSNPDPSEFDCSGLVYWAATQTGYKPPRNSWGTITAEGIYQLCESNGSLISVDEAIKTPGALLIRRATPLKIAHIAISLGNGSTMEAMGTDYGVNVFNAKNREWHTGAKLPGMLFTTASIELPTVDGRTTSGGWSGQAGTTPTTSSAAVSTLNSTVFNNAFRVPQVTKESSVLTGKKSFINDEKLLGTLQYVAGGCMRNFQSAPNGDFIAWFPDYFGFYSGTPTMIIRDIEIVDLKIYESDDTMATHVAVAGSPLTPYGTDDLIAKLQTVGIVSIEDQKLLATLLGFTDISKTENSDYLVESILQRYGMRPKFTSMPNLKQPAWEYFMAVKSFMESWASQFQVSLSLTFMPELYPGMRVRLPQFDNLEFYIESVSHSGSSRSGFSTSVNASAPTRNGKLIQGA